ncbi:MAG TPA: hypothetical protein VNW15_01955 [Rhizomicrobium sp.]|nr:hypothetical protein [Rhizomicrobium sp.]
MTSTPSAFRQSRIYAEGWNAARTMSASVPSHSAEPPPPNPYPSDPERSRWNEGFAAASV